MTADEWVPAAPGFEPSAWLRAASARAVKAIMRSPFGAGIRSGVVYFGPLEPRPDGITAERWDFTCDRCRAHVPDGLVCGIYSPTSSISLMIGLCDRCARREGGAFAEVAEANA